MRWNATDECFYTLSHTPSFNDSSFIMSGFVSAFRSRCSSAGGAASHRRRRPLAVNSCCARYRHIGPRRFIFHHFQPFLSYLHFCFVPSLSPIFWQWGVVSWMSLSWAPQKQQKLMSCGLAWGRKDIKSLYTTLTLSYYSIARGLSSQQFTAVVCRLLYKLDRLISHWGRDSSKIKVMQQSIEP